MSDFRALPHIPEGVEPGFAHVTPCSECADLIRARNRDCTPTEVWHYAPEFAGINGGETGV